MPANYRLNRIGRLDGIALYIVDGERIRNEIDIDFTCGGHHLVYPWYIPAGEVWIDNALGGLDRTATILHEMVELNLMARKGWSYDRAHDAASTAEAPFRTWLAQRKRRSLDLAAAKQAYETWRSLDLAGVKGGPGKQPSLHRIQRAPR